MFTPFTDYRLVHLSLVSIVAYINMSSLARTDTFKLLES